MAPVDLPPGHRCTTSHRTPALRTTSSTRRATAFCSGRESEAGATTTARERSIMAGDGLSGSAAPSPEHQRNAAVAKRHASGICKRLRCSHVSFTRPFRIMKTLPLLGGQLRGLDPQTIIHGMSFARSSQARGGQRAPAGIHGRSDPRGPACFLLALKETGDSESGWIRLLVVHGRSWPGIYSVTLNQ